MIPSSVYLNKYVSKSDLIEKTIYRSMFSITPFIPEQDKMIRGNVDFFRLQDGLSVHYSNARDLQDLEIIRECQPRLCISFFLEGNIEAYIGDDPIPMPVFDQESQLWHPVASIFSQCETEFFKRYAKRGNHIKKIVISISPDWLQKFIPGSHEFDTVKKFATTHLARKNWTPSPHAIAMVEQIIASCDMPDIIRMLYVESRVLMLIEEGFRELIDYAGQDRLSGMRPQDRDRLKVIEQYLKNHLGHQVTTKELADAVGVSINSLQRLLSKTYGIPASKFIRTFMLERARSMMERDGISIAEAAYLAGYNSPANFATAFKKCFGFSPSSLTDI
jgi:AraC-like DNA-binding protein